MSEFLETVKTMKPRVAIKPPKVKAPLIDTSQSSPSVAVMGDIINNAAAPFQGEPDPKKGALGQAEFYVGMVMGVVGAPFELLDTGFALVTAPLAALMPGLPAATLMAPHLGMPHGHAHPPSLIPPNPVPVPLPSIGTVMCAGCVSVMIGGIPAARAGDVGLAVTCGSLSPAFEVYTGSSNTWIGGSRAARMTDITRHCNPASAMGKLGAVMGAVGLAAGGVSAGATSAGGDALQASMQAAQLAADAIALAMSALLGKDPGIPPALGALLLGNPTVLIGGFPLPDLLDVLGAALKGLKKLGDVAGKSPRVKKALAKVGLCNDPGEPVNSFSGVVYNDIQDYAAPTGFVWQRHYRSDWNDSDGPLGYGFRHFYDRRLLLLRKRALYETHDGEQVSIPRNDKGGFRIGEGFTLIQLSGDRYQLLTDRDERLGFLAQPTSPPSARLVRYEKDRLRLLLAYDDLGRLKTITESVGASSVDAHLVYDNEGRIIEVHRGQRESRLQIISRYTYDKACIVAWQDAFGAAVRMRYDEARRMVQATDRRGYSFHWHYDPVSGRCVKSRGDDGLWGIEAQYEGDTSIFKEADGGEWTFKHFPDGIVSHILDPLGGVVEYVRDKDTGRIVKQIMPGGTEYTWVYDATGSHIGRLDPWNNSLPTEDDDPDPPDPLGHDGPLTQKAWHWGRPIESLPEPLSSLPAAVSQALRSLGPLIPANAKEPEPTRDAIGRVIEQPQLDGSVRRFQYDAEGNLIADQSAEGNWTRREIASWDLLGATHTPLGNTARYAQTHRGEWRSLSDPNANRTDYVRDQLHRVTEIHRNGTPFIRYVRDKHHCVVEAQAGDGTVLVQSETNSHGLLAARTLSTGQSYAYDYDANGNYTKASSNAHEIQLRRRRRYFFDRTPLPELDLRDGKGVRHGRSPSNELQHSVYFERFAVEYRHLADGRLRVFTPDGSRHEFWKAADGKVVRQNGNGTNELTVFDHRDRLVARLCWSGGRPLDGATWTVCYHYDGSGGLTSYVDSEHGPVGFDYDADGRLIAEIDARGKREYGYDRAGNLTRTPDYRVIEHDPGNVVNHADFDHFDHDDRGRLVKRDQLGGTVVEYSYDSLGQLTEAQWNDRPEIWRAAYDGLGRRLWREYGDQRTDFYWDGDRLAAEHSPGGQLRIYVYTNTDALLPFMWLDYGSDTSSPESGKTYYVFYAPNGIPIRVEDAHRNVVWRAKSIDAYGQIDVKKSGPIDCRLRFAGHFHDEHLGLFYNRYRDYDPKLGRYLQPDPLGHQGGINLYAYSANPWVEVDVRGLSIHLASKKAKANGGDGEAAPNPDANAPKKKAPPPDPALDGLSPAQLQDVCKAHADKLADIQDPRPGKRNTSTFAVGVVEGPEGRRLVATSNRDVDRKPSKQAQDYMKENGIENAHDTPPRLKRTATTNEDGSTTRRTVDADTGETVDKQASSEHHAEQKMHNTQKAEGEQVVAQSPSQPCCPGCQSKLSQPDANGQRPIDQIPPDRRSHASL